MDKLQTRPKVQKRDRTESTAQSLSLGKMKYMIHLGVNIDTDGTIDEVDFPSIEEIIHNKAGSGDDTGDDVELGEGQDALKAAEDVRPRPRSRATKYVDKATLMRYGGVNLMQTACPFDMKVP